MTALDPSAEPVQLEELPDQPGLYTLTTRSREALSELGLEDHVGHSPLATRVLYLGKAEESLRVRLQRTHFAVGKTGHSTVRRTLAALLDMHVVQRPSRLPSPSRKQLMTMSANYALPTPADERLSAWMRRNLVVGAVASPWTPLADLERSVGAVLKPPLDQEKVPFWAPNPWRTQVATARERKRNEVRTRIGLI